ncbi:LysR family transcriptional regulator [Brevibacterium sp. FAM 25378]|uniref:LysR family transcriptional regulator n=1 Tax=unclassified Brevibacterium TaxID=2614124 RepID=UPI001093113D|nr:LysR family transcriptional regulator [Brevibacterium sp. S22]TGD30245.1 LysR family transcriptional regulator [Brevibacterium sp. S22]
MDIMACLSFLAVFDTGSATVAAQRRFISQPALSRQIQTLEKKCSTSLFTRSKTGMQPTHAARQLEPIIRRLMTNVKDVDTAISEFGRDTVPLTIACPILVAEGVVLPFAAETNTVLADIVEYPTNRLHEALSRREADLSLIPAIPPPEFESRLLYRIPYTLQVRSDSPLARRESIDVQELSNENVIVPDRSSGTRRELDRQLTMACVRFTPLQEVSRAHIGQAMVRAGKGSVITVDPPKYGLIPLPVTVSSTALTLEEWAAWPADHYAADTISHFIDELLTWMKTKPIFETLEFT